MQMTLQITNIAANLLIFGNLTLFYIFLFGRENSVAHNLPFAGQWMLRLSIIAAACGSIWNSVDGINPPTDEVLTHTGFAILFAWLVRNHYHKHVVPYIGERAAQGCTRC